MKTTRLQFGMRESPASDRRHGSRLGVSSRSNENYTVERADALSPIAPSNDGPSSSLNASSPAAPQGAATGGEGKDETRLLTVHEVAELLRVPVSSVYGRTRKRSLERLPGYRLGKYWRFIRADVLAWIERQLSITR
jgi:excisionase family DNA binding protein